MNQKCRFNHTILLSVAMLALTTTAGAQQPTAALMSNMAANAKQLKQYTFKQRTETYHKGELKNTKVAEVHYNASGERVSIPLEEQKVESARLRGPGSRLIAKKIESKQEEMKEYIERLMALTSRYVAADPAKLQTALANAEITTGGNSGQLRLVLRNYVKTGDSLTMSFDATTKQPTRTEVSTTLDDDPVSIVLAYDQIHEGPNYPGKTVVRSAAEQLEMRIFTYDYRL